MSENEKKSEKETFLKKLKELDFKIDIEKDRIKHNDLIKEELENINASYNRCLEILSRSARGKNATQKFNDLYTQNRRTFIKDLDDLDNQSQEAKKNLNNLSKERDIVEDKYHDELEKEEKEKKNKKESSS